jgi:hypothetical protein
MWFAMGIYLMRKNIIDSVWNEYYQRLQGVIAQKSPILEL